MRLLLPGTFSVVLVSLIGMSALSGSRSANKQSSPVQVINRTQSFSVVKVERGSNEFSITLKNNSLKRVTAFSISMGNGLSILEEFVLAEVQDIGVGPGSLFSKSYPFLSSVQPQAIEVKAVIFDDDTAEGDPLTVRQIEDSRLGQQIQMHRAIKELQTFLTKSPRDVTEFKRNLTTVLNSSDDDTLKVLAELKPTQSTAKHPLSANLREGLNNGRQNILRRLSEAETINSSDSFLELKNIYEKILRRCAN